MFEEIIDLIKLKYFRTKNKGRIIERLLSNPAKCAPCFSSKIFYFEEERVDPE